MPAPTSRKPGCLTALLRLFSRPSPQTQFRDVPPEEDLPYRLRDNFLTPAELSYYGVLRSVIGPRAAICTKVRLADILFVARPHENRAFFNRIAQRHVDFLLCESSTMQPVLAIELDDSSHARPDRVDSDEFLDTALEAASLPLLRVIPQRAYSQQEVIATLRPFFQPATQTASETAPEAEHVQSRAVVSGAPGTAPDCPKCGIPMVLRTAERGPHKGSQFYGCRNYPECRQIVPVPSQGASG